MSIFNNMKTAFGIIVFLTLLQTSVFCQKILDQQQDLHRQMNNQAMRHPNINGFQNSNANIQPGDKMLLKDYLNDFPPKLDSKVKKTNKVSRQLDNTTCLDTSFVRLINTYASYIYVQSITPVSDGILVATMMYDTTYTPYFTWRSFPLLIKLDYNGNPMWVKQFDDAGPNTFSHYYMTKVFELSNRDIICVGGIDTTSGGSRDRAVVWRLNSNGNILWQKVFKTDIPSSFNSGIVGLYRLALNSLAEGQNGDLILAGTSNANFSSGHYETILRLTGSGDLVWDANYGNDGPYLFGAEGVGIYFENGQLTQIGISHGTNNPSTPPAINILTLDYNTGNVLTKKFFRPTYTDQQEQFLKSFTYYRNKCVRLNNGNTIVYGQLFSDYSISTPIVDHFGVIEFSPTFDVIKSYTISSALQTNYSNNLLFFDNTGNGLVSLFKYIGPYEGKVFFAAFKNGQFKNERKVDYYDVGMPGGNGFCFSNDSGNIYVQSHFKNNGRSSFIEFRKMHNSDVSSVCMGEDTMFLQFRPLNINSNPSYLYMDANLPNKVVPVSYNLDQNDTIVANNVNACLQVSYCDTVKIHGIPVICGEQSTTIFTAYKNPACGGIVEWRIDQGAIDSMHVLSDSSVRIYFKNANWQGSLIASVPGNSCNPNGVDSISLAVVMLQRSINLGTDTVLCANNNLTLHAGSGFSYYIWQDGSTDSTLIVTSPGTYHVSATDFCGNNYADTIIITEAYFPFSIGADTIRCNNDILQLSATAGFINYTWHTLYNISTVTGQSVSVFPLTDTFYIASAEKWPGCMVRDTVNIRAFRSPPIFLGNDTSFCAGQSLTLDAGPGFTDYYWNNGTVSQQLFVDQPGMYYVKGVAANGCKTADTLIVLNVSSVPSFSLGNDTTLCAGTPHVYNFNLPQASYLWSDASTQGNYSITTPGIYSLSVTQSGCTAKDTVVVTYKNYPIVFLGSDTTICSGDSHFLNATFGNSTYLWQDGSSLPQVPVTAAGNYYVSVNLNGCITKDTIRITYLDKPRYSFGKDTSICAGAKLLLNPSINVSANYLWQDGSSNPVIEVSSPGIYSLAATNSCGSFRDSIAVEIAVCDFYMPNSFTPNGDGVNDIFKVRFPFPAEYFRFLIFNRYGQKIFETTDISKGWDGRFRNKQQPLGSYIWIIEARRPNNWMEKFSGTITIIR
jgi:gliding motility-associated-like protein